jgi:hypothetical protein
MCFLVPIVEGHGEQEALPNLLHRIAGKVQFPGLLRVNPPIRVKSGSFLNDRQYFRKQVLLAAEKAAQEEGSVLILLDCEDHCPATVGPDLLLRAQEVRSDVNILVSLAYREFETWFIAAASSMRGLRGLPRDLEPPLEPEAIRDAKGWLGQRMAIPYDPVIHQLEFVRKFDLDQARSNRSFDRFLRSIETVLANEAAVGGE